MIIKQLINTEISKMSSVIRYSWTKVHSSENLAEHSYYVIMLSDAIAEDIIFKNPDITLDRYSILKYAMYHDVEEIFTWDIITPVKYKSKSLRDELEKIGTLLLNEWLSENFKNNIHIKNNIIKYFNEYEDFKYKKLENQIVKFADQLEAFSYSISELRMWNTNFYDIAVSIISWIKKNWSSNKYFTDYIIELDNFFYEEFRKK